MLAPKVENLRSFLTGLYSFFFRQMSTGSRDGMKVLQTVNNRQLEMSLEMYLGSLETVLILSCHECSDSVSLVSVPTN